MQFFHLSTDGPVGIVTLDRPRRLNAIGTAMLSDLHQALVAAQSDPATRVIVLTGAGRAFCAGVDLKEFGQQAATSAAVGEMCDLVQQVTRDIMFGPKLVIGAAHGHAVGAGFEWLLNCDLSVAADNLVAFFLEMSLGHFVTGGVTRLLPQTVGHQRAMERFVLGERLDAHRLLQLCLVNRVVPLEAMLATAMGLARQVATRSTLATSRLNRLLTSGQSAQLAGGALEHERQAAMDCFADPDTARRIAEFSQGKRP